MKKTGSGEGLYTSSAAGTARAAIAAALILMCIFCLSSCGIIHRTFSKKAEISFDANGGIVTGTDVDAKGKSELKVYKTKCITGDDLPDITASRDYFDFLGWFTEKEGGKKVTKGPEKDEALYAQWESSNKDRTVTISNLQASQESYDTAEDTDSESSSSSDPEEGEKGATETAGGRPFFASILRINSDDTKNEISVSFTLSKWFGQDLYFVNKKGEEIQKIEFEDEKLPFDDSITVSCTLPDRKWMDNKEYSYYIMSMENEHVDSSEITELKTVLDGQYKDFNKPIEGSMAWYGGPDDAPAGRAGVILSTDDDYVYARGVDQEDGSLVSGGNLYKWKKSDVMINLPDVRTDIVYDIYNAYSSRFFPIKGKALYSDNGKSGLKRYMTISKEDAMHKNKKTGQTTFMAPVQWDFAETVASAQAAARNTGATLYIVDTFRPMNSVGPVVKAVDDLSLLTDGGSSAHNFGMAVDTGWQLMDEKGKLVGEPYDKNLQVLDKKKAVKGPRGNEHEIWWEGVNKLQQEWWHYGDSFLDGAYTEQAKRVGSLYVNQSPCASIKRSKIEN